MYCGYDSIQRELKDLTARIASEFGRTQVRAALGGDRQPERHLAEALATAGLYGLLIPEAAGGFGLGPVELLAVSEELGRRLVPVPFLSDAVLFPLPLTLSGETRWHPLLAEVAAGGYRGALAVCETERGWWRGFATRALFDGDGYRLSGEKVWVPGGAEARTLLVSAVTETGETALFVVPADTSGVTVRPLVSVHLQTKDASLRLDEVRIGSDALVGAPGAGSELLESALCAGVIACAGQAIGGAEALLQMTVEYARERQQFGRPVGAFQAVKHRCADMKLALEQMRGIAYYAAWQLARNGFTWSPVVSALKAHVSTGYRLIARNALQVHGGIGFTWEHDLQLYYRHSLYVEQLFGPAEEHYRRLGEFALDNPWAAADVLQRG